ncbi:type I-E CRISPR-associated protein Cas6/Cse3/CasE [Streptomyces chrestomyceticus]|uniref:type I-E CRISPR-associated protein Cas6/Cse3/CasE n=1 Tax=Streptomyces chrestomyceticus TaxID=68185 RepID=UPI0036AE0949
MQQLQRTAGRDATAGPETLDVLLDCPPGDVPDFSLRDTPVSYDHATAATRCAASAARRPPPCAPTHPRPTNRPPASPRTPWNASDDHASKDPVMYLARFRVNTGRTEARRLLGSAHLMHGAVNMAFPDRPPQDGQGPRILWRVDRTHQAETTLFIVSPTRPDLTHLVEQAGWPTLETPDWTTFAYGQFSRPGLRPEGCTATRNGTGGSFCCRGRIRLAGGRLPS